MRALCRHLFVRKAPQMDSRRKPWVKAMKLENLEYVKEFYGYDNEKAKVALDILDDEQISAIKQKMNKGGRDGRN